MHFQIFIPGVVPTANPEHLVRVGLPHLIEDAQYVGCEKGPDGSPGLLIAWPQPGALDHVYDPNRQEWAAAKREGDRPAGRYWIGTWNDSPPTPKELARPYQLRGTWFAMADGRQWLLPVEALLTRKLVLSDDGEWAFVRQRKFADFSNQCDRFRQEFAAHGAAANLMDDDVIGFILDAMALNYRIVRELVPALGLFTSDNVVSPLLAIIKPNGE